MYRINELKDPPPTKEDKWTWRDSIRWHLFGCRNASLMFKRKPIEASIVQAIIEKKNRKNNIVKRKAVASFIRSQYKWMTRRPYHTYNSWNISLNPQELEYKHDIEKAFMDDGYVVYSNVGGDKICIVLPHAPCRSSNEWIKAG